MEDTANKDTRCPRQRPHCHLLLGIVSAAISMSRAYDDEDPTFIDSSDARVTDAKKLAYYRELDEDGVFDLLPHEEWWSEHYDFLLSRGYQLRRRFRPDWKHSWSDKNVSPYFCEDAHQHHVRYLLSYLSVCLHPESIDQASHRCKAHLRRSCRSDKEITRDRRRSRNLSNALDS